MERSPVTPLQNIHPFGLGEFARATQVVTLCIVALGTGHRRREAFFQPPLGLRHGSRRWLVTRSAPTDCGAVNPASGLPCEARMAASKSAISLVQGPANALLAARASTVQTRTAVILRFDLRSTPLFDADYSLKSRAPRVIQVKSPNPGNLPNTL